MAHYHSRRIVLIFTCLLPLLLTAGCTSQKGQWTSSQASHTPELPEGTPWSFNNTEGRIIETSHYRIYTTSTDALLLEKLPIFLESAYDNYLAFLPPAEADEEPLEIYLFERRSEWEAYTRENTGARAKSYLKIRAGAYSHEGTCVAYMLERYHTFGVLAHEGFHQFSARRLGHRIPAWMEEGLACNFEAHAWKAGRAKFAPDLNEFRISALQRALRNDSLFTLPELLVMRANDAVALPPEQTATFYAQAWALTRFLQEGEDGKYREAFWQLLDDAAAGANLTSRDQALQTFESYFEDSDVIAGEFVQYANILAARQLAPGAEIILVGPEPIAETMKISAEQIEQAKPTEEPQEAPQTPEVPESPAPETPAEDQPAAEPPAEPAGTE